MHVVMVSHGYRPLPPEAADSPSVVIDALARALSNRGVRVTVVCGRGASETRPYQVVELAAPAPIGRRSAKLAELFFAAHARRVVSSISADVVQYHAPTPAAVADRGRRVLTVLEWSAPISSAGRVPTLGRMSAASALAEMIACRRVDAVVVKSELSAAYARRRYHVPSQRLAIIANGVDVDFFTPAGAAPRPHTILSVARIAPYKDQATLVQALARPPLRGRDVRLILAGPADDRAYAAGLVRLARSEGVEDRLDLLGPVDFDQLPDLYHSAAVVACPSLAEGAVPLALLEAMSTGRAIVASAIPQHLEVGTDAGVTFANPGDPDAMGRALGTLLDDDERRTQAGLAARHLAEERFSWRVVAERFHRLYLSLVR